MRGVARRRDGRIRRIVAIAAMLLAATGCGRRASGLYTTAQAARGKDVYAGMCMSCHAGMGNHTGAPFRTQWNGHPVGELYTFISENMPQNDPGSLPQDDYLAVVAFLLQANGMPSGLKPLPADTLALARDIIDVPPATR
ncbi:MAG TPA: cytochrome c [Gemmatimonadales bacterium]